MYRVLLVDDEWLDLEGLERLIPWKELDMSVEGAVNNAFDALDVLEHTPIDIMVSDIKMPIMSGLELARKALEKQRDLRIVFVSGYEDFHYAKQALTLNAHGYVLKPVDDEEFLNMLRELRKALDMERHRKQLEQVFEQSMPLVRNELLLQWLEKSVVSGPLPAIFEQMGFVPGQEGPFQAMIFELDDISWKLSDCTEEERELIAEQEHRRLFGLCREEGIRFYCRADRHRVAVVVEGGDAQEAGERIVAGMDGQSALTVTASLGSRKRFFDELPQSYAEAKSVLSYKIILGKNKLIRLSDTKEQLMQEVKNLDEVLNLLFGALSTYDLVKIDDCIHDLFTLIRRLGKKLTIYNFIVHVISKLDIYLTTLNENLQSLLGMDLSNLEVIFDLETIDDIQSWFRRRLFEISEMLHLKKLKKNRKLIEEIEQYIEGILDRDFTLRDVANHFAYSPNYLGHIFRKETGSNFSDYVIYKRMEKARTLLRNPNLRINEIAEMTGFKHLTYFSRQFKETYGLTPGDYRKLS